MITLITNYTEFVFPNTKAKSQNSCLFFPVTTIPFIAFLQAFLTDILSLKFFLFFSLE